MRRIFLIPVETNAAKLKHIVQIATQHLSRCEPLSFLVENTLSAEYIDKLLWSTPQESFLPHSGECLSIELSLKKSVSNYFNLTSKPIMEPHCSQIYEFDDRTSSIKAESFKKRYSAYKKAGYSIIAL